MRNDEQKKVYSNGLTAEYIYEYAKENYDRLAINVPKGQRDVIKEYAKQHGFSLNSYILELVRKDMQNGETFKVEDETDSKEQKILEGYRNASDEVKNIIDKILNSK